MLKEISIEIIRKCPNLCLHCSSESAINCEEIISYEKFISIINGTIDLGLQTVCFSGGEPFLHPEIAKMIEYVHSKGINSYVYTSGIVFDEKGDRTSIPKSIINAISKEVTKIIFNFEASSASNYNVIMGTKNCFNSLKESINIANKASVVTEAHFVPMKINVDEVESTILLCEELGISKISFLRLVLHGRAIKNIEKIALTEEETNTLKKRLSKVKQKSSLKVRVGVPLLKGVNKHKCEAAKGKLNIKYDGLVYPCEVFKNNNVYIKKLNKPDSIYNSDIKNIYYNSLYLKTVRDYLVKYTSNGSCENCVGQYLINTCFQREGYNE